MATVIDGERLEQIERQHQPDRGNQRFGEPLYCLGELPIQEEWPCLTTHLVREIHRLRGAISQIGALADDYR
jgi:hypothetical protein